MTIAFDTVLRRPGCILVQVGMGATIPSALFGDTFPTETWLLAPTDSMKVYDVTERQLLQLANMAMEAVSAQRK